MIHCGEWPLGHPGLAEAIIQDVVPQGFVKTSRKLPQHWPSLVKTYQSFCELREANQHTLGGSAVHQGTLDMLRCPCPAAPILQLKHLFTPKGLL